MKSFLHPYELKLANSSSVKKAYLLKIQDDEGFSGYADVFPWVEFGDPSYEKVPNEFKKESNYELINRSLELAKKDLKARKESRSLIKTEPLKNHYSLLSLNSKSVDLVERAMSDGFERVKIKVGRNVDIEKDFITYLCKNIHRENFLRLDFNAKGDHSYLSFLESYHDQIEFVEDPSIETDLWTNQKIDFAYDQPGFPEEKVQTPWKIIKPEKQQWDQSIDKKVVFTSYLGHPVGQAHAFAEAQSWGEQVFDYGLMTQFYYEPNVFSERLIVDGSQLSIHQGEGIGFADLLEDIDWILV